MSTWRPLLLAPAALLLASCADLLGVEPLSGSDAAPSAASDAGVLPESGGCVITWVDASGGAVPVGAVPNPVPGSSAELYVCRVSSPTLGVLPGKLLPGWDCYYGDGRSELISQEYEVLVPAQCSLAWEPAPTGVAPVGALVCGEDPDGGILYSCRVGTAGADPGELGHVGWSTGHACVYSLSGQSLSTGDFDVLTAR
jgi:hypothetical protein